MRAGSAVGVARDLAARSAGLRVRAERQAVVAVSEQLGNTPTVCRASYIDPRVIDAFERNQRITSAVHSGIRSLGNALPKVIDEQTAGAALTMVAAMVAATPQVERGVLKLRS
ncbi:MAG: hypothetical protein ACR2M5_07355 [Nakamurella sp.]